MIKNRQPVVASATADRGRPLVVARSPDRGTRTPWRWLLIMAVIMTLLNSLKPLHMDDTAYYYFASHISHKPLDPYGFTIFWYQYPQPANEVLAPPVLPYWWAAAIRLFGDNPFLWKMWLFPFVLLFVGSLFRLFHRFAFGQELLLTAVTVFSPTFLPALNLMLDIPALALSLGSVALFLGARDRSSWRRALMAGLVAGLAMQTKYTAALAPVVMLLYAFILRRPWLGFASGLAAGLVFLTWEVFTVCRYGESHFLCNLRQNDSRFTVLLLIPPLGTILGGVFPIGILLGWTALGLSRWLVLAAAAIVTLGFYGIGAMSEATTEMYCFNSCVFGTFGVVLAGTLLAALWRSGRTAPKQLPGGLWPGDPAMWFLGLWLCVELVGYFLLSPFPAARRVMGLVVVATLIIGRLAARTCQAPDRQRLLRACAIIGIFLGLGYYAVDLRGAFEEKEAAEVTARLIRQEEPNAKIWYVGHWGFQYYAERAGMVPVVPSFPNAHEARPAPSQLRQGDWLVVPDPRIYQQKITLDKHQINTLAYLPIENLLPLRTVKSYYAGTTPLERSEGPRILVAICRVKRDFVPVSAFRSH